MSTSAGCAPMRRAGSAWNSRAGCSPCMGTGLESKRWPLTELPCGGGSCAQIFPAIRGDAVSYSFGPGQHFLPGTVIPGACSPKLHGQACISLTSSLLPAALQPDVRHGVTSGWQNLPASGGCICASAKRQGCFFSCGPTSGGGGCGPGFCCSCRFCFGHRALSGLWMLPA